jgi:hypothetical protein
MVAKSVDNNDDNYESLASGIERIVVLPDMVDKIMYQHA